MVNNFPRDNIARLTFGDLNSEISSSGQSAEISLAFTPTTLALLESTFVEFGESLAMPRQTESGSVGAWEHSTSGMSEYSDDSEDTSFSTEWTAGGKRMKLCDSSASVTEMVNDGRPTRRLPGPRPSCKDEEMTPRDLERRKRRRERNKLAATKCRQKRVDQTNELLEETKSLESESQKLEREIETLQRLKQQLEFVLEAHRPGCRADAMSALSNVEPFRIVAPSNQALRPTSLPITTTAVVPSINMPSSTSASQLVFDFPLTGLTPLLDPFAMFEATSPNALLLSPSSLLA